MRHGAARLLLAALLLAGCHREAALPPPDATYTVRGEVAALPASAGGELTVHHEAVPDFHDRKGRPEPMDSMTMPFAVGPGVSLDGIAVGDRVEMTFELRWEGTPPVRIVSLHELPAGTALQLGGRTLEPVAPLGAASPAPADTTSPAPTAESSDAAPLATPEAGPTPSGT